MRLPVEWARRPGAWAVMAALVGAVSPACYHAGSDALARAAQASFKEAGAGGGLDDELKLSKEMLDAELKAVRRETEAERDLSVALLLDATWSAPPRAATFAAPPAGPVASPVGPGGRRRAVRPPVVAPPAKDTAAPPSAPVPGDGGQAVGACGVPGTAGLAAGSFLCELNRQLVRVGGTPPAGVAGPPSVALREVRARAARIEAESASVIAADERSLRLLLPPEGAARLGCPVTGPPDAQAIKSRPALRPLFVAYAASCERLQHARRDLAGMLTEGGLLAATQSELTSRKAALEQQRAEAAALAARYDQAHRACTEAQARGELRGELAEARTALDNLASKAVAATGEITNRYARLEEARRRYDGMVRAIDSTLEGKAEASGELAIVTRTAAQLDEIQRDRTLLLLEAERLRGEVALLRVQVAHGERQVSIIDGRRKALFDQLGELLEASDAADDAVRLCRAQGGDRVAETFRTSRDRRCRDAVAASLLHYANAWTAGELRARLAGRLADGDRQDEAIEASAAALRVWEQVLAIPIDAVVRKHASGIKPEELAKLIVEAVGAAALVGIAVGVPR